MDGGHRSPGPPQPGAAGVELPRTPRVRVGLPLLTDAKVAADNLLDHKDVRASARLRPGPTVRNVCLNLRGKH